MSRLHCGTAHQRGRFCNRCGKLLPPAAPTGRAVPRASRPRTKDADPALGRGGHSLAETRPLRIPARPAVEAVEPVADGELAASNPAAVKRLYDRALARTAGHGSRPLQRYLSVLVAASGPAA